MFFKKHIQPVTFDSAILIIKMKNVTSRGNKNEKVTMGQKSSKTINR